MRFAILLAAASAFLLHAQSTSGIVLGTITDPTGASIVQAHVTLTNVNTNIARSTDASSSGDYIFTDVAPGPYRLEVQATGFKSAQVQNIVVQVGQTARMDVELEVGDVQSRVEVTAAAPIVQSETSSVGNVVDTREIQEMPLNGRANFYSLLAIAPGVQQTGSNPLISGGTWYGSTNMTIDGVTNIDVGNERLLGTTPSLDAVQEFRVIDNSASAEFGRGGAQVVMITRSGSNSFHGSLFEFNRNRALAAKNVFAESLPKPAFNRNEFGASLGGRIVRDKLFFFGAYEGMTLRQSQTNVVAMPSAAMLNGDFSKVGVTIKDPYTGQPFANNRIDPSSFSPVSKALLAYLTPPNLPGNAAGLGPNLVVNIPRREDLNRYFGRLDYHATDRDTLSGHFSWINDGPFAAPGPNGSDKFGNWGGFGAAQRNVMVQYTRLVTPRAVNELRFGYNRELDFRTPQNFNLDPSKFISGLISPLSSLGGLPTVTITGFRGIDDLPGSGDRKNSYEAVDTYSWTPGSHNVKIGFQFQRADALNFQNPPPYRGSFTFDGRYTGNSFADFLLGYASATGRVSKNVLLQPEDNRYAAFIQDDWKIRPRLTLNLGLRYDYQGIFQNGAGDISNFYPGLGKIVVVSGHPDPRLMSVLPIVMGKDVGIDTSNYYHPDRNNFGPRIGFAYRPLNSNRLVVRASYGIYYNVLPGYLGFGLLSLNPPFIVTETFEPTPGSIPSLTFANPFPGQGNIPSSPSITAVSQNRPNPQQQQWNFTIEHEIFHNTAVRASYLGDKITHLERNLNLNDPPPAPGQVQPRRPYQPFGPIAFYEGGRNQETNQLQIGAFRRFSAGLAFDFEYQLTKGLSEQIYGQPPMDNRNARLDRGNLDFVRRNYATISYSYELPFGRGKHFGPSVSGAFDKIIGGWEISGITTLGSGQPYSVTYTSRTLGWPSGRADIVGNPGVSHPSTGQWFNPAAFAVPAPFTYGNSPRNFLFGPGFNEFDVGIFKHTRIAERLDSQFRAEFFNIANHPNFGLPAGDITVSSTVGRISSTAGDPRTIQFGLKLLF